MKLIQLETPALVVDKKIFENNLLAMERLLSGTKLKLRPHYKSNKCAEIAAMQLKHGAIGITCAKLSEAVDLADSGIEDILIANEIMEPAKIAKAAQLAKVCRLTVCADNADNLRALSAAAVFAQSTIRVYIEYEIGMHRCGVETEDEYVRLAKLADNLPGLEYGGIQAYAGHVSHMETEDERGSRTDDYAAKLRSLISALVNEGLQVCDISGGSTGTSVLKAKGGLYTELQAGSYIFLDATYGKLENLPFRNSLFVLATVISSRNDFAVLDAGVKGVGMDQGAPRLLTLDGTVINARLEANEEHMKVFSPDRELHTGEKVLLIPGHCCSTVNLYDRLYMIEDGAVVRRIPITARGCSR